MIAGKADIGGKFSRKHKEMQTGKSGACDIACQARVVFRDCISFVAFAY